MPLKSRLPLISKFRFKMDPLLPALVSRACVKSKRGNLQTVCAEANEKLLERFVPKGVLNNMIRKVSLILGGIFEPDDERRSARARLRFDRCRIGC